MKGKIKQKKTLSEEMSSPDADPILPESDNERGAFSLVAAAAAASIKQYCGFFFVCLIFLENPTIQPFKTRKKKK